MFGPHPVGSARAGEAREGHVDHLGPGAHGFVNAGRLVRRVAVPGVVQHLEIDHLRVPSQPSNADAVVCGRSDQARYEGAVPVLVVRRGAKWPVVLADVLAHHNLADQLRMFWVNAGVQDRYERVGATSGDAPGLRGIYGLEVGLPPRVLDRRSRPTAGVLDDYRVPGIGPAVDLGRPTGGNVARVVGHQFRLGRRPDRSDRRDVVDPRGT